MSSKTCSDKHHHDSYHHHRIILYHCLRILYCFHAYLSHTKQIKTRASIHFLIVQFYHCTRSGIMLKKYPFMHCQHFQSGPVVRTCVSTWATASCFPSKLVGKRIFDSASSLRTQTQLLVVNILFKHNLHACDPSSLVFSLRVRIFVWYQVT